MRNAAIYARYSTDLQDKTSIDGQVRNCKTLAERDGLNVVATFTDEGISGTTDEEHRPGFGALMKAASREEFDVVLVDEHNRLARGWRLLKAIEEFHHRRQHIIDCNGYDSMSSPVLSYVHAGMSEEALHEIKRRTRRGLSERHQQGFSAGGRSYGYTSEAVDSSDPNTKYRKLIDPETASVALEIATRYASGDGLVAIALDLNKRGVPSPAAHWKRLGGKRADGRWTRTGLYSIIHNRLYRGEVIWNRFQWYRKPGSNKRLKRENPRSDWHVNLNEELRIWPDELCERIDARLNKTRAKCASDGRKTGPGQPKYILSGLLRCGECGAAMIIVNARHAYQCSDFHNGACCTNDKKVYRSDAEDIILQSIRKELLSPKRIKQAREYMTKRLADHSKGDASKEIKRDLRTVQGKLANVSDAIAKVGLSATLQDKLGELEHRERDLRGNMERAKKTASRDPARALNRALTALKRQIANLGDLDAAHATRIRDALSAVLKPVHLKPDGDFLKGTISFDGRSAVFQTNSAPKKGAEIALVAGVGFEPTTFGL
jgi:site-specific DNA recombinase